MKIILAGKYCKKLDLKKFNEYEIIFIDEFEDYSPYLDGAELLVAYGYGKIFKDDALKKKIFNLHPSILPYGRGMYPIVWSILNNHPIGYTIYQINSSRIDEGFVYSQKEISYDKKNTFKELFNKITSEAEKDFCLNFKKYFSETSVNLVKDKTDSFYKSKIDSKIILKFLNNGWDTSVGEFLKNSSNNL